jgi:hypothetical protein
VQQHRYVRGLPACATRRHAQRGAYRTRVRRGNLRARLCGVAVTPHWHCCVLSVVTSTRGAHASCAYLSLPEGLQRFGSASAGKLALGWQRLFGRRLAAVGIAPHARRLTWFFAPGEAGIGLASIVGIAIPPPKATVAFRSAVRRARRALGPDELPEITLHGLRHSHATFCLVNGMPIHVLSARLGHSSPAITLGVYSHVLPGAQDVFAQQVADRILAKIKKTSIKKPVSEAAEGV